MTDILALTRCFARIGILSFGGPAAQIALMHREVVEGRKWITEQEYLSALSFCMLLPGPEAMQLATWIGWRKAGVWGGLIAGGLFILPGAVVMLALAMIYAAFGGIPIVAALFLGVQAAVLAVVIEALLRVSKRALKTRGAWILAAAAFVALYLFQLPFPVIIATAALVGALQRPPLAEPVNGPLPWRESGRAALIWGAVWLIPLVLIVQFAPQFLAEIALFFSKLALFTFGGAYAVLSWMASEVVSQKAWITAPEMLAALGLAETTPGPLILVTEFVAYLAGHRLGGVPLGIAAAIITLWMTFAPCFLWIFAGAPWIAHLRAAPRLGGALNAILAAVVGVIAHLSLWFALHVLFAAQVTWSFGPLHPVLPDLTTVQALPLAIALIAGYLLLGRHWSLPLVLSVCALTSAGYALF
jgi:chromate transporter